MKRSLIDTPVPRVPRRGEWARWRTNEHGVEGGTIVELREGSLFYIPPIPHDSWVIGDQPYVSLHLMGAETYTE